MAAKLTLTLGDFPHPPQTPVVSRQSLGRLRARLQSVPGAREPRGRMSMGMSEINTVMFLTSPAKQG